MALKTTAAEAKPDKKVLIAELKMYHEPKFKQEGVENPNFIPKLAYIPNGKDEKYLAFFPSEISAVTDIYTEFVSAQYLSEDSDRRLWKLTYNPDFDTEYEKTEPHPVSGYPRYLVPIGELIEVRLEQVEQEEIKFNSESLPNPDKDLPMSEMTILDYMAIHQGVPCSHKAFINDNINKYSK